jgi:hypothetical protein
MKFIKKSNYKLPLITIMLYVASFLLLIMGYNLIFIVNNSGIFDSEPYQYILNSNTANGYFIISLILALVGSTFAIIDTIKSK